MILRKMRVLVSSQHANMLAYRAEIYLWVIAHTMPFIMMSVWMTASAAGGGLATGGFSMMPVEYARYFLAVYVVRQFTTIWMIYEFEWHANEGRLSFMLLRPLNALWHYVTAHLGEHLARLPFFLVMVGVFFVIYPPAWGVPDPTSIVLGIAAIYAAFALRFSMQYCVAMGNFWFERASSLDQLSMLPYVFLSGLIIPLSDLPPAVARIVYMTPFPYTIDFPVRILTGRVMWHEPAMWQGLGIMAGWFVGFSLFGSFLWKRGLMRYSGMGA